MHTLIVGAGALGGLMATRLYATGARPHLATRDGTLRRLQVSGIGGAARVDAPIVTSLADAGTGFDLVIAATKARDAIELAPSLVERLAPGGKLLSIQNGGVSHLLADRFGTRVLGGLSNLAATMHAPGVYEQTNAGHILIADHAAVHAYLGRALDVRVTDNLTNAIWSKLLLNCSVTTLGAIAGQPMRAYIATPAGRAAFDRTYDETLAVARATGARPVRMLVDPIPPTPRDPWLADILAAYGDLKPSMLQDFERGRPTEIDFINGYVADLGRRHRVPTPANDAIVSVVHAISERRLEPSPVLLERI